MSKEFKEILISHNQCIIFNSDEVVISEEHIKEFGGKTAEEYARNKMRNYYNNFFSSHFENLTILTGAGSSVGTGEGKKGKTRQGLWDSVKKKVSENSLKDLCKKIKYDYPEEGLGDIEAILSKAEKAKDYVTGINEIIQDIKDQIKEDCSLSIPSNSLHQLFINKISSRKLRDPRVKIFTLNYDTLFEQASNKGVIVIDGFSYGNPRTFNSTYFDYDFVIRENSRIEKEENYVPRVLHIYKLHGSMDWERKDNETIKSLEQEIKNPLIIYPNDEKYEVSYIQPFFEMMLRFQQSLRKDNVLLIVVGYSFYDKHITAVIKEALDTNSSLRMVIVTKNLSEINHYSEFKEKVNNGNLILIDENFEDFVKYYPVPQIYQNELLSYNLVENRKEDNAK